MKGATDMILFLQNIDENLVKLVGEKTGEEVKVYKKEKDTAAALASAEIIIAGTLDRETLDVCQKLKWLFITSAGVDALPFKELEKRKILVSNVRGIHKSQIAEQVIGAMIAFSRRLNHFIRNQHKAKWEKVFVDELINKTICIVGAGSIGQEIARKAKAFDMKVIGVKMHPQKLDNFDEVYGMESLHEILKMGDYVVLITPLTDETYNLFGREEFSLMKPGSVFINFSRGKTVDEEALIEALTNGPLYGAALDVFRTEPLPPDSPFWAMDNVIVTPHSGGQTPYYFQRAMETFIDEYELYKEGKPLVNKIDLNRQY